MEDNGWFAWLGHLLGGAAIGGSMFGWFPPVAAFVAFVWYGLQIYESKTVQRYLSNRRERRIAKYRHVIETLEAAQKKQAEESPNG